MQGNVTCRSSAGDWGAALRRRASHLRHHDRPASHQLQASKSSTLFPAGHSCTQGKIPLRQSMMAAAHKCDHRCTYIRSQL